MSAASIWELTTKGAERTGVIPVVLRKVLLDAGYLELPVTSAHGLTVGTLANHHRDPFDRIMVAQAIAQGISLVTHDSAMQARSLSLTNPVGASLLAKLSRTRGITNDLREQVRTADRFSPSCSFVAAFRSALK